jgi:hypothetical protein
MLVHRNIVLEKIIMKRGKIELLCIEHDFGKLDMKENWLKEGQKDCANKYLFLSMDYTFKDNSFMFGSNFLKCYSYQLFNLKTKSSDRLTNL